MNVGIETEAAPKSFSGEYINRIVGTVHGTTAGLGYLEINVICPCKSPHWAIDFSVRTVDPHWGVVQFPC
jgi:hypothetical protein